ncbi:SRPBCC family protein [Massilia sp. CF038]|uniref:SRPBCC family protein n=1 Tax=Massilia sp. CF038 TaxID=1881045 RepID=UPI00091AC1D2|nr:SRPBCC family protein [Massilia sp. CF038]SHH41197.1 Uncharacterized membrane protein [Massilia sp. CF038]
MNQAGEHLAARQVRPGPWHAADAAPPATEAAGPSTQAPRPGRAAPREQQLGLALGWISVGLGVASLLAPRAVARTAGLPEWPLLMRALGLREIASGVGLLRQPDNQAWRWVRVAGDAMDLSLLGVAALHPASDRRRLVSTTLALGALSALDLRAGNPPRLTPSHQALAGAGGTLEVRETLHINQTPQTCYAFWRELERLPSFMQHLESVTVLDARRSHWCARGPAGTRVEWEADITQDEPGALLAWQSVPGADVDNAGTVRFDAGPGGQGTLLAVDLRYRPPAGRAGALIARLFGEEPLVQVRADLRRFKQLIETGEIATTKGQPEGKRTFKASLFRKGVEP